MKLQIPDLFDQGEFTNFRLFNEPSNSIPESTYANNCMEYYQDFININICKSRNLTFHTNINVPSEER